MPSHRLENTQGKAANRDNHIASTFVARSIVFVAPKVVGNVGNRGTPGALRQRHGGMVLKSTFGLGAAANLRHPPSEDGPLWTSAQLGTALMRDGSPRY